jgi:hypothetical protein
LRIEDSVAVLLDEHALSQGLSAAPACRLFADKVLNLGKAARMAKLPTESFIECLGQMGVSCQPRYFPLPSLSF